MYEVGSLDHWIGRILFWNGRERRVFAVNYGHPRFPLKTRTTDGGPTKKSPSGIEPFSPRTAQKALIRLQ